VIGGPLAYLSAERAFHAVAIPTPIAPALLALALGWAILLPLIFRLDRGINPPPVAGARA
jgi:hypothetical protein